MRARRGASRVATMMAAAVLLLTGPSGCGDLSEDELTRGVESLSALAAQGELIANGVARDATKTTYTRVMAKTLGEEAEHEAEKLADATPSPGTKRERGAAVGIAGEIAQLFSELQTFPGEERRGWLVQRHMREAKEEAEALVDRLSEDDG